MRLFRPRFRLWVMMLAVAIVAVGLGVWKLRERSRAFAQMAAYYQREAIKDEKLADSQLKIASFAAYAISIHTKRHATWLEEGNTDDGTWEEWIAERERELAEERADAADFKQLAVFHTAMKQKYERAAHHPWLALEPDPPSPPNPMDRVDDDPTAGVSSVVPWSAGPDPGVSSASPRPPGGC